MELNQKDYLGNPFIIIADEKFDFPIDEFVIDLHTTNSLKVISHCKYFSYDFWVFESTHSNFQESDSIFYSFVLKREYCKLDTVYPTSFKHLDHSYGLYSFVKNLIRERLKVCPACERPSP